MPNNDQRKWEKKDLEAVLQILDRLFFASTLQKTLASSGWQLIIKKDPDRSGRNAMRPSEYPCGLIEILMRRKTATIKINTHASHWCTAYPAKCDGYEVANRMQHVCHVIAHERVHVVCRLMCTPHVRGDHGANNRYDEGGTFQVVNKWIFGHPKCYDDEVRPEDIDVSD